VRFKILNHYYNLGLLRASMNSLYGVSVSLISRMYIKASQFFKNTPLRVVFSTLFSVPGNVVKHGLSCLIYYYVGATRPVYTCLPCTSIKLYVSPSPRIYYLTLSKLPQPSPSPHCNSFVLQPQSKFVVWSPSATHRYTCLPQACLKNLKR